MKPRSCFLILMLGSAALPATAEEEVSAEVAAIGLLPTQRVSQRLAPSERNPFAEKVKEEKKLAVEDTETQEARIRAIFRELTVSGMRSGSDGRRMALVGDLILREGEEVRQVLPDQTEILIVSRVDDKKVELVFVENKDATQPRTIVLPVNGQARVAQRLAGQPVGSTSLYYPKSRDAAAEVAALLGAVGTAGAGTSGDSIAADENPDASSLAGIGVVSLPENSDALAATPSPEPAAPAAEEAPGEAPAAEPAPAAQAEAPAPGLSLQPPAPAGLSLQPPTPPTTAAPTTAAPAVPPPAQPLPVLE